jgi:hypothetical protein
MSELKFKASAKVMRSYDYCHFEITLGSDELMNLDQVDDLRKHAAVLVDEAVRQYKKAKNRESNCYYLESEKKSHGNLYSELKNKLDKGEELTPEEVAALRMYEDDLFWSQFDETYDYYGEYQADTDHHFTMLEKFKKARIAVGLSVKDRCSSCQRLKEVCICSDELLNC